MSKRALAWSGAAAVAVFAGVLWFARESAETDPTGAPQASASPEARADANSEPKASASPGPKAENSPPARARAVPADRAQRPAPTDPRLAALLGAPEDALVEYRAGPDGRVIQEIDDDPNSQGYRKPLREYSYAGDQLAVVTVYKYLGGQVQVIRAVATYKADGSVDQFRETTEYRTP